MRTVSVTMTFATDESLLTVMEKFLTGEWDASTITAVRVGEVID